ARARRELGGLDRGEEEQTAGELDVARWDRIFFAIEVDDRALVGDEDALAVHVEHPIVAPEGLRALLLPHHEALAAEARHHLSALLLRRSERGLERVEVGEE